MKHLLLLTLLAGCPAGNTGAGTITATWDMLKGDGTPDACPTGAYHTMKVSAAGLSDDSGAYPHGAGETTVGLFDCALKTGTLEVPGAPDLNGIYVVWFEIGDEAGNYTIMEDHRVAADDSAKLRVDVTSGTATAHMPFYPNAGWLALQWELYASVAMQRLTSCEAGAVDRIEVELVNEAMVSRTLSFPCTADNEGIALGDHMVGGAYTPMATGDYTVTAKAYSGAAVVSLPRDPNTSGGDLVLHVPDKNGRGGGGLDFDLTNR
jgi:hypothetical protein